MTFLSLSRINAIEAELKQTHTSNGVMKKDVKQLKDVRIDTHRSGASIDQPFDLL